MSHLAPVSCVLCDRRVCPRVDPTGSQYIDSVHLKHAAIYESSSSLHDVQFAPRAAFEIRERRVAIWGTGPLSTQRRPSAIPPNADRALEPGPWPNAVKFERKMRNAITINQLYYRLYIIYFIIIRYY